MTAVNVSFSATSGIYTSTTTDTNGNLIIGPKSILTQYAGDTTVWQVSGAPWQDNGDSVVMNNQNSGDNFLTAVYPIQQATATEVIFRVKCKGQDIASVAGNNFGIELILTDSGGLGGTILGQSQLAFPSGSSGWDQYTVTVTPSAAAYYVYAYIFARSATGIVWVKDPEVYAVGGTAGIYGEFDATPKDIAALAAIPLTGTGLTMEQIGFYYNELDNIDGLQSAEHSLSVLSNFPILICNEPGQNTTSRQQWVQQQLVDAGKQLFGYINVGVPETAYNGCMAQMSEMTAAIDRCSENNYAGVFFDGAGGGVPIEEMNYLVNYSHGKNLSVIANSHPQDILYAQSSTTLTAPATAPTASAVTDASSTLQPGNYEVGYTWTNYNGETTISPTASVTIASGQAIQTSAIAVPNYVLGVNLYISQAAGGTTLGLSTSGYGFQTNINALPSSTQPPTTNAAYIQNNNGIGSSLSHSDWCLWESFYSRDDNQYAGVPEGGFINVFEQYQMGVQLAQAKGVKMAALAYQLNSIAVSDTSDWIKAYVLAAGLGFQGLCYTTSATDGRMPWVIPPTFPALGNTLQSAMVSVGSNDYEATTDEGVVQFTAVDSPVSRSYTTFATGQPVDVTVTATPPTSATKTVSTYQAADSTSADTWTPVTDLTKVTERFLSLNIQLAS